MQLNATHRIEYSNKLTGQGEFREFDVRHISLSYTLNLGHTVTLSSAYDDRVLHGNIFCGMRNAEFEQRIICGTFRIKISAKYT